MSVQTFLSGLVVEGADYEQAVYAFEVVASYAFHNFGRAVSAGAKQQWQLARAFLANNLHNSVPFLGC